MGTKLSVVDGAGAKIEILADKLYRALLAMQPLASAKAKAVEHTVVRFATEGASAMVLQASDGKAAGRLTVPIEGTTKQAEFCLHALYLPTVLKVLAQLHQDQRDKTAATLALSRKYLEITVDSTGIRVPLAEAAEQQDLFASIDKMIPAQRRQGVHAANAYGLVPATAFRLLHAAAQVSSCVRMQAPKTPDSPIGIYVHEGKAGITGAFGLSPASLAKPKPQADDDERQTDLEGALDEGDGDTSDDE